MAIALVLITLIIADAVKFIAEKIYEYFHGNKSEVKK